MIIVCVVAAALALYLLLYFLYWSDLLLYWSDPLNCPTSVFDYQLPAANDDKFLVVGTGFCGLAVCGSLKRNGIAFDAVEVNDQIGGNWFNGVYTTVHIISSRRTTEYRDYQMPSNYPDFPSAQEMLKYLNDYCDQKGIREHIMFNTRAENVEYISARGSVSKYRVTLTDCKTGKTIEKEYKGVIIANGHHWDMRIPKYANQSGFTGEIIHSKQYKKPEQLVGKRVLVVGGGNSACDIVTEAARFGKESHLSLRRGYWFLPRCTAGQPTVELTRAWMPIWLQRLIVKFVNGLFTVGKYSDYGLPEPDHALFEYHPTVNSTLLDNLKLGTIKPHGDIDQFLGGNKIKFKSFKGQSNQKEDVIEADMVVFCTGFYTTMPLLKGHIEMGGNEGEYPPLIRSQYVPNRPNLYVAGLGQVRYGAGSMYTAEAEVIAKSILAQDKLGYNVEVADIWTTFLGAKVTKRTNSRSIDILLDPHSTWKQKRTEALLLEKIFPLLGSLYSMMAFGRSAKSKVE